MLMLSIQNQIIRCTLSLDAVLPSPVSNWVFELAVCTLANVLIRIIALGAKSLRIHATHHQII